MGNIGVELHLKTVVQRWEGGCAGSEQDKRRAEDEARQRGFGKQVESWRRRVRVDWGLTLPEMSAVFENGDGYGRSYIKWNGRGQAQIDGVRASNSVINKKNSKYLFIFMSPTFTSIID
jgi:hypothetical protein